VTAVTGSEVVGRLVHVDTVESLAARIVPGEAFPDWSDEPTPAGEVPTRLTVRDWVPDHVMVTIRAAASRTVDAQTGAPAIAVVVVVGALYEVRLVPPLSQAQPPQLLLDTLSPDVLERLARRALIDSRPFVRSAVHAASATVSPTHPLLITELSPEQVQSFDLGAPTDS